MYKYLINIFKSNISDFLIKICCINIKITIAMKV